MILEALEWCVTPCAWFARRRGLLAAQIGIRHRANRCRTAWKPHLDACRQFVAESLRSGPRQENLVILGSGHLNDFDLPFLLSRFARITLVDAVHPLEIQIRARFSKGRLNPVTADLCQFSKPVADLVSKSDWTVSSCLLSQLPLFAKPNDSRAILSRHLELLATAPRSILITDVAKRTSGESEWTSLLEDSRLPESDAEWIWTIAPPGENGPVAEERLVRACRNIPSGLVFEINARQGDITAAHKRLPFHTPVRVTDLKTGKSIIVRINNRGPFIRGRIIDLSVDAAKQLGTYDRGIAKVQIQALREVPVMRQPNMRALLPRPESDSAARDKKENPPAVSPEQATPVKPQR